MGETNKSEGDVTFLNRGKRHFEVAGLFGNPSRRHAPGTTMTYSAEEAKRMEAYKDLVDISKLPGQVDTSALKADNAKLLNENEKLKKQLASLQSVEVPVSVVVKAPVKVDGRKKKEEVVA